jgi:competence protein ComEC
VKKVGQYRIIPFLKSKGIWELDYAFITHTDADHISGLKELLLSMDNNGLAGRIYNGNIVIRHLVLPYIQEKNKTYLDLISLAESKGIEIFYIQRGDAVTDGNISITCLHPLSGYTADSLNAYSTVLSVKYKEFDLLLTGDLEADGESLIMKEKNEVNGKESAYHLPVDMDYDILKVAHHGSKNSTLDNFLSIVKPEYSIVSCGKDNRYGHPNPELLQRRTHSRSMSRRLR